LTGPAHDSARPGPLAIDCQCSVNVALTVSLAIDQAGRGALGWADELGAQPMTVVLTGRDLTRDELTRVARGREAVAFGPDVARRMAAARAVVERALERDDRVYGLSTAVGVLKRVGVAGDDAADYSRRLIRHHQVGQGPLADRDLVRGTILRLANAFASGTVGVRPELAERLVDTLNGDAPLPAVRIRGSIGQADLAPMADLAAAIFADVTLAPGEGLALVSSNAFSTAWSALAVTDAAALLDAQEVAGALSLEGLAANPTLLHPAIEVVRPYPGLATSLARLRDLLRGSFLWSGEHVPNLQDPLSFRNLPHIQGAARDVLTHVDAQLAIELNASQGNPIAVPAEDRLVSVANYEILPLVLAIDYLRTALASSLSAATERVVKLLETPWSGLPNGLAPTAGTPEPGLAYLGIACQALTAEARLLATPVSYEIVSTAHAEGIEDRATMAPLAARRLAEMVDLGARIVAVELTVGAQAAELRGIRPLGAGTARALAAIRAVVPFLGVDDVVPDVEPLVAAVRAGRFGSGLATMGQQDRDGSANAATGRGAP
jgi:histidine ammonia-lyase